MNTYLEYTLQIKYTFQQNLYKLLTLQRLAVKIGNSSEKQNSLAQKRFCMCMAVAMLTRIIPLRTSCYRFILRYSLQSGATGRGIWKYIIPCMCKVYFKALKMLIVVQQSTKR
jgi:hypothetical protein